MKLLRRITPAAGLNKVTDADLKAVTQGDVGMSETSSAPDDGARALGTEIVQVSWGLL
eukprot:CAMPEP_0115415210 /NCGR_PEP_ID=MMETSP0271-20121206/22979_1 /TAXON_ID=71861 /ORGANISM="Scrippsiella trochoidea, Strain CCMP3099" /LENGTH=57 /DNA_ID=CAMNT_0002839535 /DNA_START=72 /DNA_END=245 /DNA_ORIENTATION=-